jgi:hypothetical protein
MASPSQGPPTAISFPPERARAVPRPLLLILFGPELGLRLQARGPQSGGLTFYLPAH